MSVGWINASGSKIILEDGKCQIMRKGRVIDEGKLTRNLYLLQAKAQGWPERAMVTTEGESWEEWHGRFGHVSTKSLQGLKRRGMVSRLDIDMKSEPVDARHASSRNWRIGRSQQRRRRGQRSQGN